MSRRPVRLFVSYAHRNAQLAAGFLDRLDDVLAPSRRYAYSRWSDHNLLIGDDWDVAIKHAMQACDVGLLLISPSFLASRYITQEELPGLMNANKPVLPVMLQPVDFDRHDLKGLQAKQIFRLQYEGFSEPRAYGDCKGARRESFVLALFGQIEAKLDQQFDQE